MRQLAAVILLLVQLFGFAGLPGLLRRQVERHRVEWEARVEEGAYDPALLVERKVPLHQPYYSASLQYERYYGEALIDGIWHTYVMRKVYNDTVYLLCLPDHWRGMLEKSAAALTVEGQGFSTDDGLPGQQKSFAALKKMPFSDTWYEEDRSPAHLAREARPSRVHPKGGEPVKGFVRMVERPPLNRRHLQEALTCSTRWLSFRPLPVICPLFIPGQA